MKKSEIIKGLVCMFTAIVIIVIAGSWDYRMSLNERYYAIPDCVYEHITLVLGDNATKEQVVEYYDTHRIECDKIELDNM